jgi:GntR family transcriptional repressor for pyruvate dehydrogenase complex
MPDWNLADLSNLPLEPIEQSTMSELVAKRLIKLLSNGTLKAGDRIPPERDLAVRLRVGRTTLREALKLLTISGVLETKRGDGTYVCAEFGNLLSHQLAWPVLLNTHDVDMVLEVRSPLEVQAARLAAQRATPADLERIGIFRQLLTIEGRDTELETTLDLEFHDAIASTSRNKLLCDLMRSLHRILRQYIMLSNEMTARLQTTIAEHQKVYDAIAAHDPDAAESAMNEHLAWSKDWITSGFGLQMVNQRLSNHHQPNGRH